MTSQFREARQYTAAIERSPDFLEELSRTPDQMRRAYGAAALNFVTRREEVSPYIDIDTQAVKIIGLLAPYVEGCRKNDEFDARRASGEYIEREEREPYLRTIIRFNHAIRDVIDANPHLTTDDILKLVGDTSLQMGGKEEADYASNRLRRTLVGMQHEIAAEQALWAIEGVEDVIHADEAEELKGIDLKVVYNDRIIELDIKAGLSAVEASRKKAPKKAREKIVWSGVENRNLGKGFRVPEQFLESASNHLKAALDANISAQSRSIA